jgi:penicillin-binding protein 1B
MLALLVWLDVLLAQRFGGQIWSIPSQLYSDARVVAPGDRLSREALVRRLDRSGYARVAEVPARPGQYREKGSSLQVHVRRFGLAGRDVRAQRVELRFRGDTVVSIGDERGRGLAQAVIEPEPLATLFGPRQEDRRPIKLEEVPPVLRQAVLAAEDARFYEHRGIDPRGILRAAWTNLTRGRISQGGSTITQQTVKNLFLDQRRTLWRKVREGVMALLLDARYSKDRIFEVYLNHVYLGQRGSVAICGIQAAAQFYLGRGVRDLSLAESALLAGLIQSPGRHNPFADPQQAIERRDAVLDTMKRLEWITPAAHAQARAETLRLASGEGGFAHAAHVVDYVQSEMAALFPEGRPRRDGLRISTTLDTLVQERAEQALRDGLARLDRRSGAPPGRRLEGSVIVVRPSTGAILALVGGRDYASSQFNRAVQARRQPGSCFKPFVYAAGFEAAVAGDEAGLTPATMLEDTPLEMLSGGQVWRPENYDGTFRERVSVRQALRDSLNVPTVRAALSVGLVRVVRVARRLGIESPLGQVPSLALGAAEVTPLELATAYTALARGGSRAPLRVIRQIADGEGHPLVRDDPSSSRGISPQAAFLVNDILQDVLVEGTARSAAALGYSGFAAGKTGTTDDTRDAWFAGYTPELLALVWVGYDDGTPTGLTGASGALPIWVELMRGVDSGGAEFPLPEGIVRERIDPQTGGRATGGCPEQVEEWFPQNAAPVADCTEHGGGLRRFFRKLFDRQDRRRGPRGAI